MKEISQNQKHLKIHRNRKKIHFIPSFEDFNFGLKFWLVLVYSVITIGISNAFIFHSRSLFKEFWLSKKEILNYKKPHELFTIISIAVQVLGSPGFGYIADKWNLFEFYGLFSPILLSLAMYLFIKISPLVPIIMFSIASALNFCAVWSNLCISMPVRS